MHNLLWLDLETSGLEEWRDDILMVAAARADAEGNLIESREWVVRSNVRDDEMDPIVLRMHTENGLLARVRGPEARDAFEVESELLEFVGTGKPILAGNNIGFDRKFLMEQMPAVDGVLQYRPRDVQLLDVSMLRRAAMVWGLAEYPKVKRHLALDDIKASIAEFMHWKKAFGR